MDNKMVKDVVGAMVLGVCGCICVVYNARELAGVCFGALATWILKNGYVNSQNKTKS